MHAVGSKSGPNFGFSESISGPHFRVNKWSTSETDIIYWFQRILVPKVSREGSEFSSLSGVLVQKEAFQEGDGSHPRFQFVFAVVVGGC